MTFTAWLSLHHFLSLVIMGRVRPRWPRHFDLGRLLLLFRCLDVHSVVIIVHLLCLNRETWPAHLCLSHLKVSTMAFTLVCCRIHVLLFLPRKARRCDSKPRTHIARDRKWWRSTGERYFQEEWENLWFGFGYLIFSKNKTRYFSNFPCRDAFTSRRMALYRFKHKAGCGIESWSSIYNLCDCLIEFFSGELCTKLTYNHTVGT